MTNNRRLYACACLAGPMVDAGLGPQDADALKALLSGTLDDLASYAGGFPQAKAMPLLSLLVNIIECNWDDLTGLAAALQWEQRKAAYERDCLAWKAAEPTCDPAWRNLPMTRGQRYLIADTAALLEIEIPEDMDRGAAADWLDANNANVVLRLEEGKA
ncbi:hypothetical protein [Aurantiacibacter flavus]|uniref:Uncharacterized protein n=1 Tax=Aurantiacibacter flavus TaxID=3145232 RepID=A0ABV0CUP8_9SPHN